jgi:membrane dipeptidase
MKLHEDSIVLDMLDVSKMDRVHLEKMRDGGVTAANVTVTLQHGFQETVELMRAFDNRFDEWDDLIVPVRSTSDIRQAKTDERVGIIYGVQNACPIENDLRLIQPLHSLGLRVVQLAYMTGNLIGDGCLEPRDAGLTLFGGHVVQQLNEIGILIDLSHCGERTTLDTIEQSQTPVVFSHACAARVSVHPRNKSDAEIRALAERGGVMGVTSLAAFVSGDPGEANLDRYLDHIEHVIDLVGVEHVGLGMDFVEGTPREAIVPVKWGGTHVPAGLKGLTDWPIPYARDIESSDQLPNVTAGLISRGYDDDAVQKVLGGNFLRVLDEVWR